MKKVKFLGSLLALALITILMVQCKTTSPTTQKRIPQTENKKPIKIEDISKVTEPEGTTKTPKSPEDSNAPVSENPKIDIRDVATVAIVYPKHAGDIDPCTTETNRNGKKITHVTLEKGMQLCDMSDAQVEDLANDSGYAKKVFCECIINFCSEKPKADEFVKCLNKPEKS